ncbi:MAG: hypothetical protein IJ226_02655 [Clostridia bacterium]|nr:hypothetical protein [Clostridia bacterium]
MKKFLITFSLILLLVFSLTLFVACDTEEIEPNETVEDNIDVVIDILSSGFSFSEEYKSRVQSQVILKKHYVTFKIDKYDYSKVSELLPTADEIIVPQNKRFIGWHLPAENYEETSVNEENWIKYVTNEQSGTVEIFARWVMCGTLPQPTEPNYGNYKIVCDLGDSEAYFYNAFDESKRNRTYTVRLYGLAPYHIESRLPNPLSSQIVMPQGRVFEGWYFEDGTQATDENFEKQKFDSDFTIRVVAHWTTEDRVYLRFYTYVDAGYPYSYTLKFKTTDPTKYPLYTRNGHQDKYITNSDYNSLLQELPTIDDIEVVDLTQVVDYDSNEYAVLEESFAVFEWRIFDSNQREYVAITEDNWQRIISSSKTRAIGFELYYELANINQYITVYCEPENENEVSFTEAAKEKYGATNSMAVINVARNDYNALLQGLPTPEDFEFGKYVVDQNYLEIVNSYPDSKYWQKGEGSLGSIEWRIVLKIDPFDFGRASYEYLELTEENWNEVTKQHNGVYLDFTYTRGDENFEVPLALYPHSAAKDGKFYYTFFSDEAIAKAQAITDKYWMYFSIDRYDYSKLLSLLPTKDEFDVYTRVDGEFEESDLKVKSISWSIRASGYNHMDYQYELNEENWYFVTLQSYRVVLDANIELE